MSGTPPPPLTSTLGGMRRCLPLALVLAPLACSSESTPEPSAALEVVVRYDSSLAVAGFRVAALAEDGAALWDPEMRPAPLFLEPPGPREAPLSFPRPGAGLVTVVVDGLDEGGAVIGSGQGSLQVPAAGEAKVMVALGPPVTCGDGALSGRETCDDGGREAGDGCSVLCTVEVGWTCTGAPSVCGRCGDGVRRGSEACDDGNNTAGDGCSPTCELEGEVRPFLVEAEALAPFSTEGADWAFSDDAHLRLEPLLPGERWVIFASGVLGSTSDLEESCEAGLFVDGVPVSRFGHQTFGETDNGGGFLAFYVLEEGKEADVSLGIASIDGVTTVSQVRLVGMRVAPGVPMFTASTEDLELVGRDLGLLSMELPVDAPGRYLLMGQASFTEGPGEDTARMWMVTPTGKVPEDERGVTFSSSRDANVPFFAAQVLELGPDQDKVQLELRGTSSGYGSVEDWWSWRYPYRRVVTVTAEAVGVPGGYAVPITFDHAAMVASGLARADGADVRVVYANQAELSRVVDPFRGWNRSDTTVWVALPVPVEAGSTLADLFIYSGATRFDPAPADPLAVFSFYDGFDGAALQPWWEAVQAAPVANGNLTVEPGQTLLLRNAGQVQLTSVLVEARMRYDDPATSPTVILGLVGAGEIGNTRLAAYIGTEQATPVYGTTGAVQTYTADTPDRFHRYGVGLIGSEALFIQAGQEVGRVQSALTVDAVAAVTIQNGGQANMVYDWIRARPYVEPEPVVAVEPVTGFYGLRPSRFSDLRLLAINLDALGEAFIAVSPERVTTTESATVSLASVEVPGDELPREHFVLMNTRVAGETAEWARKEGLCMVDEQAILRTDLRINRDDSDQSGYHHVAAVVDARTTSERAVYATGIRSPDGIEVEGASSSAVVVRF